MSSGVQPDVDSGESKAKNRLVCPLCHRKFTSDSGMRKHAPIHTGERPFVCDICRKGFAEKATLNKHLRTHTGEKPYVCNTCQRAFSQISHLKIHCRLHTGEKPYTCVFCQRTFVRGSELKIHLRVHTQEKPYVCDICQREFQHRRGLNYHYQKHTGEKPYACDKCPKKFPCKYNLKLHVRNRHDSAQTPAARVRRDSQGNICYRNICPAPPKPTPCNTTRHIAAAGEVKKKSRWRSILPAVPRSATPLTVPVVLLVSPQLPQQPATVPLG